MNKHFFPALLAVALSVGLLSGCAGGQAVEAGEPLSTVPVEVSKPLEEVTAASSPAPSSSENSAAQPEAAAPSASASSQEGVSSAPSETASSSAVPSSSSQAEQTTDPLKGKGVSLAGWQWIDQNRLAFLTERTDTPGVLQGMIYDRRDGKTSAALTLSGKKEDVGVPFSESRVVFTAGDKSLFVNRPSGAALALEDQRADAAALPPKDEEYDYQGMQFSSDGKYYFYERFPAGVTVGGVPASDRLVVDTTGETDAHPVSQITFPFDIRISKKSARWINYSTRVLVQADVPEQDKYSSPVRTYYIYSASDGSLVEQFTLGDNGLEILDTYKTRILFAKPGEPYQVLCYDYKDKTTVTVASLEGQNRQECTAKFSPDGAEVAVVRLNTDLTPAFYTVPAK